jgi:hypothetical protein
MFHVHKLYTRSGRTEWYFVSEYHVYSKSTDSIPTLICKVFYAIYHSLTICVYLWEMVLNLDSVYHLI